jgi:imidazolonepropionase
MPSQVDLLVVNAAEVVTCAGFSRAAARGTAQADIQVVRDAAVAVRDGRIVEVGDKARLESEYVPATRDGLLDAAGGVVLPGFVDPHTHLVFAGDRLAEWERRLTGETYLDILRAGGGILSTVRATRAASFNELLQGARRWARRMLELGTTTLEVKSGYCLDREGELRLLEVAGAVGRELPLDIVRTFLGAHLVPPEYAGDREGYLALVEATQAEARARSLADFVDVFCEREAFTLPEAERLLRHAKQLGFGLKLHAEQLSASGAARLGGELGAASVDHLEYAADTDVERLGALPEPPVAVLLPGATFHLGDPRHAPARKLVRAGVPIALATDFNPGSSPTPSMPMIVALATRTLGLSVAECIVASTINAAHAVGRAGETGSLESGKRADLVVCDIPDHRWLGYAFGFNPVRNVVAAGRRVVG